MYCAGQKNLSVNLFGILHVLQAFVPRIVEQGQQATIVNTGSKQGITCPPGNLACESHDCTDGCVGLSGCCPITIRPPSDNTAKAGVKVVTEGLQHELRGSTELVKAHLFVPGWVNTMLAIYQILR